MLKRFAAVLLALGATAAGGILLCNGVVVAAGSLFLFVRPEQLKPAEVAIVLGAGPGSPTLDARLAAGLELWQRGIVRRLLISGGSDGTGYGETAYMWRYLVHHGVPASAITTDSLGMRTLDSVWRARKVFGFQSAIVVTQRYHAYRGVFLARWHGLDAEAFAAQPVDSPEFRHSVRREWAARAGAMFDVVVGTRARYGLQMPTMADHPSR